MNQDADWENKPYAGLSVYKSTWVSYIYDYMVCRRVRKSTLASGPSVWHDIGPSPFSVAVCVSARTGSMPCNLQETNIEDQ